MRKGEKVTVRMPKGANREGKFVGRETNRGEWWVIQELGSKKTFKARPSMVLPA